MSKAWPPIRIPIEAYNDAMLAAGYVRTEDAIAFVNIRVFPPEDYPLPQLIAFSADETIYEAPETTATTEELF